MRCVVVLVLASLATPAHADDELDVPGLDATDMRGDALVWEDAAFYVEPWDNGLNLRFSTFQRGRRDEVGRAIPIRIVDSSMRTFVEIELVDRVDCANRRAAIDPRIEALRLFVKRDDLAPVLTRPFSAAFSDGTAIKLAPGVPVMPTATGLYALAARGDKVRVPIPHTSVGYVYTRGRVVEPEPPTGPLVTITRNAAVRFADEPFDARAIWFATKPAKPSETAQLKLATRCIELVVSAPSGTLRAHTLVPHGQPFTPAASAFTPKQTHYVLRGAPLITLNGREAAVAAELIPVPAPVNDTSCFESRLTMSRLDEGYSNPMTRTFKLCAAAGHVALDPSVPVVPVVAPIRDAVPAPLDVGAPPSDAKRTAKGVWWKRLRGTGGGRKPKAHESVRVHYTGWTTDGKMFDSSRTRGQPAVFPLTGVIAGWVDGLQLMSIGDKVRLWIPEPLAYKGSPGRPPGMLVFDVELLDIL
jgi:hypothetical protein